MGDTFDFLSKPQMPAAPDYQALASQQGQNNIDMAKMTNPNVISPYGTQTVSYSGPVEKNAANFDADAYIAAHPDVGEAMKNGSLPGDAWFHYQNYGQPSGWEYTQKPGLTGNQATITQSLSPEAQKLFDQQMQMKGMLGSLGIQGADALRGLVGTKLNMEGLPGVSGGADTRQRVMDAMMSRVNQDTANTREDLNSNLIAAGMRPGSKGYDDRMNLVNRGYNDARNQAYLASGQEASREFGMDTQRRAQALSEMLTQRQMPLNEINSLMSGSQVQNPFAMPGYQNVTPQGTPYMQAGQLGSNYATDVYNAGAANQGNLMSGLFGLGSSAIGSGALNGVGSGIGSAIGSAGSAIMGLFSDRRLKSNIQRIGTHPLGIGWYEYDIFGRREQGVMADEVEQVRPEAVSTHDSGYKMVDYGRLTCLQA